MVSGMEVLDTPPDSFRTKSALLILVTPHADVKPGAPVLLRGIAMGDDCGVAAVETSVDAGAT